MNLTKVKTNNKGFYYYIHDQFASFKIYLRFNYESSKINNLKASILTDYMCRTNAVYKTLKDINDRCRELYGLKYDIYSESTGIQDFIVATVSFINPAIIKDDYFNDAIFFFKDMIMKPNFENGLDQKVLNEIKNNYINAEMENEAEPKIIKSRTFFRNVIPNSSIVTNRAESADELKELLASITDQDIIDFYYEVIDNFCKGIIFGNFSLEQIDYIINELGFETKSFNPNYSFKETLTEGELELTNKDTSQSSVYIAFDIPNYDKSKKYIYNVINQMLNLGNGLLLKVLRQELGIIYSADSIFYSNRGFLLITANIDKKNKDVCLKGIDEIFKRLHDEDVIEEYLNFINDKNRQYLYTAPETIGYYLDELTDYVFEEDIPIEKHYELIEKLRAKDIITAVDNLEKKFVFFFRGDKDE